MRIKRAFLLIFLLLAAVVLGAFLASVCRDAAWLGWLSYSRTVGFSPDSPLVLDLGVFRFSFGFSADVSVAQVLTLAAALVTYSALRKKS